MSNKLENNSIPGMILNCRGEEYLVVNNQDNLMSRRLKVASKFMKAISQKCSHATKE